MAEVAGQVSYSTLAYLVGSISSKHSSAYHNNLILNPAFDFSLMAMIQTQHIQ